MFAKIKEGESFDGVESGFVYPTNFQQGAVLEGGLAQAAIDSGKAEEISHADFCKIAGLPETEESTQALGDALRGVQDQRPPVLTQKDLGGAPDNKNDGGSSSGRAIDDRVNHLQSEVDRLTTELQADRERLKKGSNLQDHVDTLSRYLKQKDSKISALELELEVSKKNVTLTLDTKAVQDELDKAKDLLEKHEGILVAFQQLAVRLGGDPELVKQFGLGNITEEQAQKIVASTQNHKPPVDKPDLAKPVTDRPDTEEKGLPKLSTLTAGPKDKDKPKVDPKSPLFGAGSVKDKDKT